MGEKLSGEMLAEAAAAALLMRREEKRGESGRIDRWFEQTVMSTGRASEGGLGLDTLVFTLRDLN